MIIAGKYKGKQATYLRDAGDKGCCGAVAIEGDTQQERTLWLASLKLVSRAKKITKEEVLSEMADLSKRLEELRVKVEELE